MLILKRIPQYRDNIIEENGSYKRAGELSVIIANRGNSIGESLFIGCFLTATLSSPSPLLGFQTRRMNSRPRKFFGCDRRITLNFYVDTTCSE